MDPPFFACLDHDFVFVVDIFIRFNLLLSISEKFLALLVWKWVAVGKKCFHAFRKSEIEVQFCIILFSLQPYNLLSLQKLSIARLFPTHYQSLCKLV